MSATTPLLADRNRDDEPANEVDADVDHTPSGNGLMRGMFRTQRLGLCLCVLIATLVFLLLAGWTQNRQSQPGHGDDRAPRKRIVVMMVSDGMGPASLSLARSFRQLRDGLPPNAPLALDRYLRGSSRTRSSNSLVTDSAAGATAFSCGLKTYNGAISIMPDGGPCGTVLEAAHQQGFLTGLIVTTNVTDATPACFASHATLRSEEDSIALQEVGDGPLGRTVDLILGGGRCRFLPNSTHGSCRADDTDVLALAAAPELGWSIGLDRAAFDAMQGGDNVSLPALGLFTLRAIPFELDRGRMEANDQTGAPPSLSAMASTALRALDRAIAHDLASPGFFLMIEGSRIDNAGHGNDPAAQAHEVLEYDRTFQIVLDYLAQSEHEGVLVSTSDHETGGLALALQEAGKPPVYDWYPAVLLNVSSSSSYLGKQLRAHTTAAADAEEDEDRMSLRSWIETHLVQDGLGISDATAAELDALVDAPDSVNMTLAAMVSLRAHIGWSTHGHSATDVNVYAHGTGRDADLAALRGNVENTEIGVFLRSYLDVDVDAVTRQLRDKIPLQAVDRDACLNGCESRPTFL